MEPLRNQSPNFLSTGSEIEINRRGDRGARIKKKTSPEDEVVTC
jgi:hypothetical protein